MISVTRKNRTLRPRRQAAIARAIAKWVLPEPLTADEQKILALVEPVAFGEFQDQRLVD